MEGCILSIERCSLHDGPGLRTTVFLKGCPLSCLWCHNPESKAFKPELYYLSEKCSLCGLCESICKNHSITDVHSINHNNCNACGNCVSACTQSAIEIKGIKKQAQDVIKEVLKDMRYFKQSGGGLTVSGGEPLAQFNFTLTLLRLAKENGVHTCVETSGFAPTERILKLMKHVDLFLFDFKDGNDETHKKSTGVSNSLIIENLRAIDAAGAKTILRCPIIPTMNDRDDHFAAIAKMANSLENIQEINIMPYHPMGASKAASIGQQYLIPSIDFATDQQIDGWLKAISRKTEIVVKNG